MNTAGIKKERMLLLVILRCIADLGCLSRISDPNFFHHGSGVKKIPGSGSASKKLRILTHKIVSKLSEILSRMFIPDPDLDFLPISDPGVKKSPDPGSGSATLFYPTVTIRSCEREGVLVESHRVAVIEDCHLLIRHILNSLCNLRIDIIKNIICKLPTYLVYTAVLWSQKIFVHMVATSGSVSQGCGSGTRSGSYPYSADKQTVPEN